MSLVYRYHRWVSFTGLHTVSMSHLWIGRTVWRGGLRPLICGGAEQEDPVRRRQRGQSRQTDRMMKSFLCSLLCCASLLLSDVRATYRISAGEPQPSHAQSHALSHAQSHAQTRNNGRPPIRTLNPASKSLKNTVTFSDCFTWWWKNILL